VTLWQSCIKGAGRREASWSVNDQGVGDLVWREKL